MNMTPAEQAVIYMATKSKVCNDLFEEFRLGLAAGEDMDSKFEEVNQCVAQTLEASLECVPQYDTFGKCVDERGMFGKCKSELKEVEKCVIAHKKE